MSDALRVLIREILLAESDDNVLATSSQDGYTLEIVDGADQTGLWPNDPPRAGTMYITSPNGKRVQAGYWMDWPESGNFNKNKKKNGELYYSMPKRERAQAEASLQLKYGLKKNFDFFAKTRG